MSGLSVVCQVNPDGICVEDDVDIRRRLKGGAIPFAEPGWWAELVKTVLQPCLIEGKVEETIPGQAPGAISLLRLDTDWYESTAHELKYMYPALSAGGVLIIDDYGHWRGSREATDEYFSSHSRVLLNRLDYSGRIAIKP